METPASRLRTAAYNGIFSEVRRLLIEGVDPNIPDEYGRTALSLAAGQGHAQITEALLSHGAWADLHEDYDTYETPLMVAAANGHLGIVRMLIDAGANPSFHVGVAQRRPEAYARENGHSEIAEFLAKITG